MKITIRNETVWPTRMLRPFIVRVANYEFDGSTPKRRPRPLYVTISYGRSGAGCSGHATLGGSRSTVRVPHPTSRAWRAGLNDPVTGMYRRRTAADGPVVFPVRDFVHVLAHEFAHNVGIDHGGMGFHYGGSRRRPSKELFDRTFPWVASLPVPVVTKKVPPSPEVVRDKKLKVARAAVARWTRKRKLADTKLKYWTRRVTVLERAVERLATAACLTGRVTTLVPVEMREVTKDDAC